MSKSRKIPAFRALVLCLIAASLPAAFGAGAPAGPSARISGGREQEAGPSLSLLEQLYKENRCFELRDAVASLKAAPGSDEEFYLGAVDNVFNRLDSAIARLQSYLDAGRAAGRDRPLDKQAWILLADSYRRSGRYKRSAEVQWLILERFGSGLDAAEKTNRQSQSVLWSAVADVPPQTIELQGESVIAMENRTFPVRIKDRDFFFSYDTGASLSVLYQSAAEELGLPLLGEGIKIESGTGRWIGARLAVAPELRLGRAVVRNAVFLVLPDDFFPVRQVRPGVVRRGLIGAPVLVALKEFTETRDGRLIIPASPRPRPVQNMFFYGTKPITEPVYQGARLRFFVDTGSSETFLYPPFFRRYRDEIQSRSTLRESKMGGVGGERTVPMHILDEFAFQAGGRRLSLKKIVVHTQATHSITETFDGTLGRDVLIPCSRMTFNFESMSFILEE